MRTISDVLRWCGAALMLALISLTFAGNAAAAAPSSGCTAVNGGAFNGHYGPAPSDGGILGPLSFAAGETLFVSIVVNSTSSGGAGSYLENTSFTRVLSVESGFGPHSNAQFSDQYTVTGTDDTILRIVHGAGNGFGATELTATVTCTAVPTPTTTSLNSSQNPSFFRQSVTFTATVMTNDLSTATGTVTFKDGTTSLGTVALDGSGMATLTTSSLSRGTHSITAEYGGDGGNLAGSVSPAVTQNVTNESSETTLQIAPNPSTAGDDVTLTATVSNPDTSFLPTGTITFKDLTAGTTLGSVLFVGTAGSVTRSITVSTLLAGSHDLQAHFSGGNYIDVGGAKIVDPSDSPIVTLVVNPVGTAVALVSSLNPSAFGQSVTFTATVASATGTPTGTVTFKDGATTLGTSALDGSGSAILTTSSLAVGSHSITAEYPGDGTFGASASPVLTQVVDQSSTTVALASSQNPSTFGEAVTFTATVADSGGIPTGTVTFKDGATVLGTGALNGAGEATFTTAALAVGAHSITAEYGGDGNFAASASSPLTQTVSQAATATAVASSKDPSAFGEAVTFTATVTNATGTPTGPVTFKDGASVLGTGTLNGAGVATFTTSALVLGTHAITAAYAGDGTFAASVSPPLTQTVEVPADSVRVEQVQKQVAPLVAQTSGDAISSAIAGGIAGGFDNAGGSGGPLAFAPDGVTLNLSGASQRARFEDAFGALAYADRQATDRRPLTFDQRWNAWVNLRGTGLEGQSAAPGINGLQINVTGGASYKLTPRLLVGAVAGYEHFTYTATSLSAALSGDGGSLGGYLGWRSATGLRLDAAAVWSGLAYTAKAGAATGAFTGSRWLVSAGLTGSHPLGGFVVEPSARLYAVWESQTPWTDSLAVAHPANAFSTGRAALGGKVAYPWTSADGTRVTPYVGAYADYRFGSSSPVVGSPVVNVVDGWSARVTGGIGIARPAGATFGLDGELGGFGSSYLIWSARARAGLPF